MIPASLLSQLPGFAASCYPGPWQYAFEDCRAVLTTIGDTTVIAVPGTHGLADIGDLFADQLLEVPWYSASIGIAPEGSMRRAGGLYRLLSAAISGSVVIVGHSLGGAFAEVLAALLVDSGRSPAWLETYGAPHACGVRMQGLLSNVPGRCYENGGDPIPHVTMGLWRPWTTPTMIGDLNAADSLAHHAMAAYGALLTGVVG